MAKDIKSVKVNFNLRNTTPDEKETGVNCIVRYNNQRLVLTNIERVQPRYWNQEVQRGRNTQKFNDRAGFNARLDKISGTVKELFRDYVNSHNSYPSIEDFRAICKAGLNQTTHTLESINKSFSGFITAFIAEMETGKRINVKTGRPIAKNSIKIYRTLLMIITEFEQKRQTKLTLDDITLEFYEAFKAYMTFERNYASNTIGKHIRTIKTLLNEAFERKMITQTEYKSRRFKTITEKADTIYLDNAELEILQKLDLSDKPRLERVRDLFLVGCWTGLRFSDFSRISKNHIQNNTIRIETQKTGEHVAIPILGPVSEIMERYRGKTDNSLPLAISNQKMNEYLKELGKEAKLNDIISHRITKGGTAVKEQLPKHQLISTHTARRSFATNMFLMGAATETIMAITGHRTSQAFMKYIRVSPQGHADKLREVYNRQGLKAV